jgi:pyruvate, water dikinase
MSTNDPAAPAVLRFEAPAVDESYRVLQRIPPGGRRAQSPPSATAAKLRKGLVAAPVAEAQRGAGPEPPAALHLAPGAGALVVEDLSAFDALARRADVPGAAQVRQLKFLMTGVGESTATLYLVNTAKFDYHYDFYAEGLGGTLTLEQFNAQTYFRDQRQFVAGSVVLHDSYESGDQKGLFAVEFWPSDPVKADLVAAVVRAAKAALPFAASRIAYHPASDTQERLFEREQEVFEQAGVNVISSRELFKNISYQPMNIESSFGVLRIVDGGAQRPATARDVLLFKGTPPNELSHVAGIITETPQTPLSHINLKAKQNHTPNAFIRGASQDPAIVALIGTLIRYEVAPDAPKLHAAQEAEADAYLAAVRPKTPQSPPRDLTAQQIVALSDVAFSDAERYGVKACNVSELARALPRRYVPEGFAVPFYFYDELMKSNGLYDEVSALLRDAQFQADAAVRQQKLEGLQKKIKKARFPQPLAAEITALQAAFHSRFGAETPIRCRSSSNNEDLKGFNGAGLYDSFTHRPDEGDLEKTVKQVYASLWNFRAFEERDFYRIDHFAAAMGVLVHPNEDDEQANGVAYTKNIVDPSWPGFYVNAQVGESLVTNPGAGQTPDEFLVSRIGESFEYETQYISYSSETEGGKHVLSEAHIVELVEAMERVHARFAALYGRSGDMGFGMDIEFKVRKQGTLQIKQARPIVA